MQQPKPKNYRERWYSQRGLPYEPPWLGDLPPFRCVAMTERPKLENFKPRAPRETTEAAQ